MSRRDEIEWLRVQKKLNKSAQSSVSVQAIALLLVELGGLILLFITLRGIK